MGLDAERTQVRVIAEERVRELIRTRGIDPMRDHDAIRDAIEQTVADAVGEALASGEALRIDPVQLALEVQHVAAQLLDGAAAALGRVQLPDDFLQL